MRVSATALRRHRMPSLRLSLEAARERLTGERMAEAGLIAATVAATMVLSHALLMGLDKYTILGL